ncbi:MAG: AraC family transcriptional regulator [Bacteroidales bacterium]|nr:AraC family transcriptional regulator [Bacteroidales bacterium]
MDNITNSPGTFRFAEISRNSMDIFELGKLVNRLDRCGLFICRQGSITLAIDQKEYVLVRGGVFIYMPSAMLRPVQMSEDAEGLMVSVDIDYIIQAVNKVSNIENVLYLRDYPYTMLAEEQFQQSLALLQMIWKKSDEIKENKYTGIKYTLATEIVKSMGQVAFFEILNAYFDKRPSGFEGELQIMAEHSKRDMIFFKFLVSLYKNYTSERDVAFYAEEQNLSSRYFSSIIKEKSGHSALQWIVNVVIGNIKQALEGSDLSIKEIAMNLNFPTQSFFGKYFKQYVGVSPKEYRERMRGTSKKDKK